MDWVSIANALASIATAFGVFFAGRQLRVTKQLARTQFEDDLTRQYREITKHIPVEALLGGELDEHKFQETFDDFFRYIDLTNEQVFLREKDRVSKGTWNLWCDGIRSTLSLPSFKKAWDEIKRRSPDSFNELRKLEASNFQVDPRLGQKRFHLLKK